MIEKYTNFRWGLSGEYQQMEVSNGKVLTRVPAPPVALQTHESEKVHDLKGQYLLPSFIDSHCHILPTGLDLKRLHLGQAQSKLEVLQLVRDRHEIQPDGWLHAVHYNQTRYEGGEHLTRFDLDQISSSRPILLRHVNGHASVANSAALVAAKVDEHTKDPAGGTYRRDASGCIDGVLLERAHEYVTSCAPMPSITEMAEAIVEAGVKMSELGIGCASDMMTGVFDLDLELRAYALAAKMGCPISMRLYLQWSTVLGPRALGTDRLKELAEDLEAQGTVRINGLKIFADGGISSATAAIYGKYQTCNPQRRPKSISERETDGQLIYTPTKLNQMVCKAHDAGYQVSVHSIGDYSTDLVLDAFALTDEPSRHRIEHAMILSDPQIERMKKLGCFCTFQPEFLMRLSSAYRHQLGDERASKLIRSRSVIDAGIPLSFSSDRPIVAGDPWDGIRSASNRLPEFDPTENCSRSEAILAYTACGADVNRDKGLMGTLDPGSLAQFQICASDPMVDENSARIS